MSTNLKVEVVNNDVIWVLKRMKRGLLKAGVLGDLRRHQFFTPRSLARRRKSLKARKREARAWQRITQAEERRWGTDA